MRTDVEARRERDAQIVRLRSQGWTLRRIGGDPRVRLSVQGVADVLARQAAAPRPGAGLAIDWYRRGAVDGDRDALLIWHTYKQRIAQLMAAAADRLGVALADIDCVAAEGLRKQAGAQAEAELAKVVS